MKRYLELLASYIVIALLVVWLYAPQFCNLRPTDPSLLRAGFSIIFGIVLAGAFVGTTMHTVYALQEPDVKLLASGDVAEAEDVRPTLELLTKTEYVGSYAQEVLAQIESAERKLARIDKLLADKFETGSITWEKFAHVVHVAYQTILKNAAQLANKIQAFDVQAYQKAKDDSRESAAASEIREAHAQLYESSLQEMRDIVDANERLLLELARLEDEITDLEDDANREDNERMLHDMQTLIDQTKFYQS